MPRPKSCSASGKIDHVNFTGSVGRRARHREGRGRHLHDAGLELGGKDPAYVLADAKLDHAIANLVEGAFFNSGQCCCGIERVYVHEKVYDEFVEGFVAETKGYVSAIRSSRRPRSGPMAQARFADFIREQKAEALRKGATAHMNTRDARDKEGSPYLPPKVLTGVNHQMSRDARGKLWADRRHHEGAQRRGGHRADERQPLRPDRLDLDARHGTCGCNRRPHRDRHRVHEPLRLSRSGAGLDRRQGHRQGRGLSARSATTT
jgi:hypothetical protein